MYNLFRVKALYVRCICYVLFTLICCNNYYNTVTYKPTISDEIVQRDAIYRFFEIFSLGNTSAIPLLKNVANNNVVTKFSSLSGNTETRVNVPEIWTYTKVGNKVEVVFNPKITDYLQLYQYTFEFDLNTNKIGSVTTLYLYRGDTVEN